MAIQEISISSFSDYLDTIKELTSDWKLDKGVKPYFRGQSDGSKPPLPRLFRKGGAENERDLTSFFKRRARMYTERGIPEDSHARQLSLMQHVGLPTRLLDWTESAGAGLFFAVHEREELDAVVWLLNPIELNKLSAIKGPPASNKGPVKKSYALAFRVDAPEEPPEYPIAVAPTEVHIRITAQCGRFTIHGKDTRSFVDQFRDHALSSDGYLVKLVIPWLPRDAPRDAIRKDLELLGISYSTLFPDLDGLARELRDTFAP